MTAKRFQVSTRRTGLLRIVKVELYDEADEFNAAYAKAWTRHNGVRHDVPQGYSVLGTVIPRLDWEDRDPRPYQARMLLRLDSITATLIAHEAAHAAMHIYSIDGYRDHARASVHLHGGNEMVPYMVGDIFSGVAQRIVEDLPMRIGYGSEYTDYE